MAVTLYQKTIGVVPTLPQLRAEINADLTISPKFVAAQGITFTSPNLLDIYMSDALTTSEETALDVVIAAHTPEEELDDTNVATYASTTDPSVTDDESHGVVTGDRWYNSTTNLTYVCTDNTEGAAVWLQETYRNNFTATTAPTVNDDAGDGYTAGSYWLNNTSGILYTCEDATTGAAVWSSIVFTPVFDAHADSTSNPHTVTAAQLPYAPTGWETTSVDSTLGSLVDHAEVMGGTGRFTPVTSPISQTGLNELTYTAGTGHIIYTNFHKDISWSGGTVDTTGWAEDTYYIYVTSSEVVTTSTTEPNRAQNVILGLFYYGGTQIGTYRPCGCVTNQVITSLDGFLLNLGIFIYDNSGLLTLMPGETLKVVSPTTNVQLQFTTLSLNSVDSDDAGISFFSYYNSADDGWARAYLFEAIDGQIGTWRYNDATQNASVAASAACTFTNASTAVTSTTDLTSEISDDDVIYLTADGATYMNSVASVTWTGTQTDIVLDFDYAGTGGTGATTINRALPRIPTSKWIKSMVVRGTDSRMYLLHGGAYYDTEAEALGAPDPNIPDSLKPSMIKMAHLIFESGETDLTGLIYDIRPLPFTYTYGGQQGGGASGGDVVGPGSSTDHALVRFDGGSGKIIQDSTGWTLTDAGILVGATGGLILPQSATPTVSSEGQIAWDTDGDFLVIYDGTGTLIFGALSDTTPLAIDGGSAGTSTEASRSDHVHAHGDQAGGTLHADALYDTDGFMPATDKHWANHAFDSGWAEGGVITYGTGLVVDITLGEGFTNTAGDETTGPDLVEWTAGSVTLAANALNYVYVTSTGVKTVGATSPDPDTNIILGTAFTNATAVSGLATTMVSLQQSRSNYRRWINHVFGGAATDGLITTENGGTALHLDVALGVFYISGFERTLPAADTDISWTYWYSDGSPTGWTTVTGVSAVNVTNYDDGDGTLGTIPTNRWKKDLLFITESGDGIEYHMVYATDTYTSQAAAEAAPLPAHPEFLRRYAARISGIVVQQGATSIASIVDEKKKSGQAALGTNNPTQVASKWVPVQSSSALQESNYGRQIVVPFSTNGGGLLTFVIPPEAVDIVKVLLYGIPASGAAGSGKNIDFFTDYGTVGESPTTHQESDTTTVYDFTGQAGLITPIVDLAGILTSAAGGDVVGLEVDHNSIGGTIEYLGVSVVYEVLS